MIKRVVDFMFGILATFIIIGFIISPGERIVNVATIFVLSWCLTIAVFKGMNAIIEHKR